MNCAVWSSSMHTLFLNFELFKSKLWTLKVCASIFVLFIQHPLLFKKVSLLHGTTQSYTCLTILPPEALR